MLCIIILPRIKSDVLSLFVVRYLDAREMWIPNDFAAHCFVLVMYSIQVFLFHSHVYYQVS